MKIGAHVSIRESIANAPLNAARIGCECFQMFTRSPQGGKAPELDEKTVKQFKANCKKHKLSNYYIHTPYYINLASSNNRIRYGSISVIRDDLERGSSLGAKALMTHLGSSTDRGPREALEKVIEGIEKILTGYSGTTQFLIEMSAGSGNIIGDSFEEIAAIINGVPRQARDKLAVCFDTCHAFVSGYDLHTKEAVDDVLKKFDQVIGLSKLKLIHANDAKNDVGSHVDRHEHIGYGKIGRDGFYTLMHHPALKDVDFVLETPPGEGKDINDLKMLKELRG